MGKWGCVKYLALYESKSASIFCQSFVDALRGFCRSELCSRHWTNGREQNSLLQKKKRLWSRAKLAPTEEKKRLWSRAKLAPTEEKKRFQTIDIIFTPLTAICKVHHFRLNHYNV